MIITAPEYKENLHKMKKTKIFLAGGISGCEDWQAEVAEELDNRDKIVFNPRRNDFPSEPTQQEELEQVRWEIQHMDETNEILFWFSDATIQPITLFEFGKWLTWVQHIPPYCKPLYVGIHPNYPKRMNLHAQIALTRPDLHFVNSIRELLIQIDEEH